MKYFKKCPKCGRYMASEIASTGHVIWTCICGNVVHTGVADISCDNKTIYTGVEQAAERLTKKTDEGIWVKESRGENVMKTLYRCYGAEPLPNYSNCDEGYCGMEKLAEYETAKDEGRLVILPKCSIGDTVYIPIDFQNKIYTGKVDGFEYSPRRKKWVVKIITDDGTKCYEAFDDFRKTFFLDIEEAAKALKEMEGNAE